MIVDSKAGLTVGDGLNGRLRLGSLETSTDLILDLMLGRSNLLDASLCKSAISKIYSVSVVDLPLTPFLLFVVLLSGFQKLLGLFILLPFKKPKSEAGFVVDDFLRKGGLRDLPF